MGLVDRIISTTPRTRYLEAVSQTTPESVPRKVLLTDSKSGETNQKVNKYVRSVYSPNQVQSIPPHQYAFRVL